MAKRKCGTCRHFKDGGIASSGWCQHPARRDLQHMVLVRKTELACRNSWDQDLWETSDAPARNSPHQPVPTPLLVSGGSGSESASMQRMSADEAADRLRTGDLYTDRVTSISMPLRPSSRLDRQPLDAAYISNAGSSDQIDSAERSGLDANDARSVVREARRRQLEQRKVDQRLYQERIIREADTLLGPDVPRAADASSVASSSPIVIPPTTHGRSRQPEPTRNPIAPAAFDGSQDAEQSDTRHPHTPPAEEVRFSGTADRFEGVGTRPPTPADASTGTRAGHTEVRPTRAPRAKVDHGTEPLPIEELNAILRPPQPVHPSAARAQRPGGQQNRAEHPGRAESNTGRGNGARHAEHNAQLEPPIAPRPPRWIIGSGSLPLTESGQVGQRHQPRAAPAIADLSLACAFPVDPIDHDTELRSVPRCCGTCRDFKRLNETGQGWCTNPHAFTEQRMVESDSLACRSSSGLWWLPHDDLWLERADTTHHGRPTPMLDRMAREGLAGKQEMDPRSS